MGKSLSRLTLNSDCSDSDDTDICAYAVTLDDIRLNRLERLTANRRLSNRSSTDSNLPSPSSKINCITEYHIPETFDRDNSSSGDFLTSGQAIDETLESLCDHFDGLVLEERDVLEEIHAISHASTPDEVLSSEACNVLTPYERMEISRYQHIYFIGAKAEKRPGEVGRSMNSSYDDHNGFYMQITGDHIAYRYEVHETLGRGSFAIVVRAYDHKYKEFVAIKVMQNRPSHSVRAEREMRILEFLRKIDTEDMMNVIHIKNAFVFRSHPCLVFELMSVSMYQLIGINEEKGFSMQLTRKLTQLILQSLDVLNRFNIFHGDLKPENILKRLGIGGLKLADFGMSRIVTPGKYFTDSQVQTRWFRAPEVIISYPYGVEIDMWSVGCIVAEFITGSPLLAGENESDQIALIIELIGLPPKHMLQKGLRSSVFFHPNGTPRYFNVTYYMDLPYIAGRSFRGKPRGHPATRDLALCIGDDDDDLIDFLKKCFTWDPARRITPRAALKHPWIARNSCHPKTRSVPLRLRRSFDMKSKKKLSTNTYLKKDHPLLPTPQPKKTDPSREHNSELLAEPYFFYSVPPHTN